MANTLPLTNCLSIKVKQVHMQAPNLGFFSVPQAFQGSVKQALFLPNLLVEWPDAISGHEQIQKQLHQFLQQHMLNALCELEKL